MNSQKRKRVAGIMLAALLSVCSVNADEWKVEKASACLKFGFTETLGIARQNEPVVISGKDILAKLGVKKPLVANFRLFGPEGEISMQIDECDKYGQYIKGDKKLDAGDELVFLANVKADSKTVYQLYYIDAKTAFKKPVKTDIKVKFVSRRTKGYDLLMENSVLGIGIFCTRKAFKKKPAKGCNRDGSIVMLRKDKTVFNKVQLPFTHFQRYSEPWEDL